MAGVFSAGAFCAETITGTTRDLTMDEYLDFLEPRLDQPDPDHPGQVIPGRAGAICQSTDDWNQQKTALEEACRILGSNCTYELQQTIQNMQVMTDFSKGVLLR